MALCTGKQVLNTAFKDFLCTMYILASDYFEKDDNYVFKARNSCCVVEKWVLNVHI